MHNFFNLIGLNEAPQMTTKTTKRAKLIANSEQRIDRQLRDDYLQHEHDASNVSTSGTSSIIKSTGQKRKHSEMVIEAFFDADADYTEDEKKKMQCIGKVDGQKRFKQDPFFGSK